jgi:nucleoside-diphosphate-sugar epimerase
MPNNVDAGCFVNMFFAAKEAGIKRFIYAAGSSTYGDYPSLLETNEENGKPLSCKSDAAISQKQPVHHPCRKGDVMHSMAAVTEAQNFLGYHPENDINECLKEANEW